MDIKHINTFRKYNFGNHPIKCGYRLCGDENGYGLLKKSYPKDVAIHIVNTLFTDDMISHYEFIYEPRYYNGKNCLQETVTVYYKEKLNEEHD